MTAHSDPTAIVIIIGAEVLAGKVQDANGPFLIRALRDRGIKLLEIRTIDDDIRTIRDTVRALAARCTFLFTTGGIGPTHDDVTIEAIAEAFERPVVRHPELEQGIREHFPDTVSSARLRLADVPEGAEIVMGEEVLLPVIRLENVTILPGVPSLMRICFERIADTLPQAPMFSRALLLDCSETQIAGHLEEVQQSMPMVSIGSYPRFDHPMREYRVKVTVDGRRERDVVEALSSIARGMEKAWIIGEI